MLAPRNDTVACSPFRLAPFDRLFESFVAGWVTSEQELRMLAPSTKLPLTASKVAAWVKPGGHAYLFFHPQDPIPVGYGELNPMKREAQHLWLGHFVVRPDTRRQGVGLSFALAIIDEAFARLGARRISLIVFPENFSAIRCYERAGFRSAGAEIQRFADDPTEHRFLRMECLKSVT